MNKKTTFVMILTNVTCTFLQLGPKMIPRVSGYRQTKLVQECLILLPSKFLLMPNNLRETISKKIAPTRAAKNYYLLQK